MPRKMGIPIRECPFFMVGFGAGAKEAGIEEGRNNNVGKNETQNRVSEIGTGGKQLKRRSAHLTEINGIKAGMCYVEI